MINKLYENKWFVRLFALFLTFMLFFFVNNENSKNRTVSQINNVSSIATETIDNVPVHITGSSDNLYIKGIPETVSVTLRGPQTILNQTIEAQDFRIVTEDISELGVGSHYIKFLAENLSENVTYDVNPNRVLVEIDEEQTHTVTVSYDEAAVTAAEGYVISGVTVNPLQIQLIGNSEAINSVDRVYINLNDLTNLQAGQTLEKKVIIEDSSGNKLDVATNPSTVTVQVKVTESSKTVPVTLNQTGTPAANVTYTLSMVNPTNIKLLGSTDILNGIASITIPVDVTGVTQTVERSVNVPVPEGVVSVAPQVVNVRIAVATPTAESSVVSSSSAAVSTSSSETSVETSLDNSSQSLENQPESN